MSDFYKKFLTEEVPRAIPGSNKQVFLGAFGKHPGWDDHVEDLGLETGSLIQAKIVFYVQGIGGEIDAGAWEKLEEPQRLPAFKHVFVWYRARQLLPGRLWSSSDGKGRTRYPMVVCVHCTGISLSWALNQVLPRLEQIEQACLAGHSAAEVRAILGRYRAELRNVVSGQATDLGASSLDTAFITKFAARPELGPRQEGWMRLLYAVQNQFAAFARGKFNPKADASTVLPQQSRVPRAAESPAKAILQWANFFVTQVDPLTPTLLTVPLEEPWIDVTLGEPTSQELFCLRATPKAMPLASEVPYNLSEEFRARCRSVLAALESGRPPGSFLAGGDASAPAPSGQASSRNRFLKWFGGGAAVFLTAALGAWLAISHKSGSTASGSRQPEARPAEFIAAARQSPKTAVTAPPAAPVDNPISPADDAAAKRRAEENRLAEEKRLAEERVKAEIVARQKAVAEDQEKARLAADAEAKRLAEQARLAAERMAEEKRAAEEKKRIELARVNPESRPAETATKERQPPRNSTSGYTEFTNLVGMVLVQMPAGYWVGKYEVTQAEFEKVMRRNPSTFKDPVHPVETVNWDDGMEFCRKLTELESSAGRLQKGWAYTLPSESQWAEFVAEADLAGAVTSMQRAKRANPEPVGSTQANRLGLYDVRGNVWEWCLGAGEQKVLRGGGFDGFTEKGLAPTLSVPFRWTLPAEQRRPQAGFRCVLVRLP